MFLKLNVSKHSFRNIIGMSTSLDLDQASYVGPSLGPNCLQSY